MAKAIALAQQHFQAFPADYARKALVAFCALALIGAGRFLPF